MEKGRVFRMFVFQEEVDATEEFLQGTGVNLKEFYSKAFEEGKKALLQDLSGNEVFVRDGITGEMILLNNTSLGLAEPTDRIDQIPHQGNVVDIRKYRNNKNG